MNYFGKGLLRLAFINQNIVPLLYAPRAFRFSIASLEAGSISCCGQMLLGFGCHVVRRSIDICKWQKIH